MKFQTSIQGRRARAERPLHLANAWLSSDNRDIPEIDVILRESAYDYILVNRAACCYQMLSMRVYSPGLYRFPKTCGDNLTGTGICPWGGFLR
jgi:hypothetical protein